MPKALTIRSGNVRVRIFASKTTLRTGGPTAPASSPGGEDTGEGGPLTQVALPTPRTYTRHEIRWTDFHGKRRRLKRSSLPEAKREAQRIADDLNRGAAQSELSLADLASFRAAVVNLLGTGKTLELATAEYADCVRALRAASPSPGGEGRGEGGPTLREVINFYLAHRPSTLLTLTVADAVKLCLDTKTASGISDRWRATLRSQLDRFAADFTGPIGDVNAGRVQQWRLHLQGMPDKGGRRALLHPRSRNNHLAAVQTLFQSPELRHHPERQNILDLAPMFVGEVDRLVWKPDEFATLLTKAAPHLLPVLVLGGFAAVRSAEIRRLDWSQVRLEDSQLRLFTGQTKTKRRRLVPLPECAVEWLRGVTRADGPIWPWGVAKFSNDLRALAKTCGYHWRENALRKSAITYRELLDCDTAANATAAGNSPGMIAANYLAYDNLTRADAVAWFALRPPQNRRLFVPLKEAMP